MGRGGRHEAGRHSQGPWTEAPPGKWEQHGATEMEPHKKAVLGAALAPGAPAGQVFRPDSLQGSLLSCCHQSHTSEPSTPIKHLLWQGTRGQTWSS